MIIISVALALLIGVVIFYQIKTKRITQAYRRQKAEVIEQRDIIARSLEEKEVLLKEIHHRVKNNLQLVSSLLQLQSNKFEDELVIKALEEGQGRIQSMAMIHQMLYENEDLTHIGLHAYLHDLSESVRQAFGDLADHVDWHQEKSDLEVNIDTAVPIGLIANELIYNCFKYAFAGKEHGKITLEITHDQEDNYCMQIADDGHGLPEDFKNRKKQSLGMRLVEALSRQLDGKVEFGQQDVGTEVKVYFRLDWNE